MQRTLLLATTYEPLGVISWKAAIKLYTLGKIEVVAEYDRIVRSVSTSLQLPAVVRLLSPFKPGKKHKLSFSRANIYARDKWKCQYCAVSGSPGTFTFDHVVPRSKGGTTCWVNIVTCCKKCNNKKGSKSPEDAGMRLVKKPVKPTRSPSMASKLLHQKIPCIWKKYLYWFEQKV